MGDGQLPPADERFMRLIVDYFATQHLFIAEGEGARCLVEALSSTPKPPGRKAIYYADTSRHQSPGIVDSLRALEVNSLEIVSNRLELIRRLPAIFSQCAPPFRVYIAASTWVIEAAEEIALKWGVSKDQIMAERYEPSWRMAVCAACGAKTLAETSETVGCSGCGMSLRVTDFYRARDHLHLAVPQTWDCELSGQVRAPHGAPQVRLE